MNEKHPPYTIANLRAHTQNAKLTQGLQAVGMRVVELPSLVIKPLDWHLPHEVQSHCQVIIFISVNAAKHSLTKLMSKHTQVLHHAQLAAIGPVTQECIQQYNLPVNILANPHHSLGLLNHPKLSDIAKQKILIFKGQGGRTELFSQLSLRGANVYAINAYQRACPNYSQQQLKRFLTEPIDVIVVTSVTSLLNLIKIIGMDQINAMKNTSWLCASQRIALKASSLGIRSILISNTPTDESLIARLSEWARQKQREEHGQDKER